MRRNAKAKKRGGNVAASLFLLLIFAKKTKLRGRIFKSFSSFLKSFVLGRLFFF